MLNTPADKYQPLPHPFVARPPLAGADDHPRPALALNRFTRR